MNKKFFLPLIIFTITLSGCLKDDSDDLFLSSDEIKARDEKIIQDYFKSNNITDTIADPTGVYIKHITVGTGESPKSSSTVTVKYELYKLPGDELIPQTTDPYTSKLTKLIAGWKVGIPYMKKGGVAELYIPTLYAYGGQYHQLANDVLRFRITLIDFE